MRRETLQPREFGARERGPARDAGEDRRGSRDRPRAFDRDADIEPEKTPIREKPVAGKRKHISVLRAERRAELETERVRVQRGATQDRRGRTVAVERISPANAKPDAPATRNARRFRDEREPERAAKRAGARERPPSRDDRAPRSNGPRTPRSRDDARPRSRDDARPRSNAREERPFQSDRPRGARTQGERGSGPALAPGGAPKGPYKGPPRGAPKGAPKGKGPPRGKPR